MGVLELSVDVEIGVDELERVSVETVMLSETLDDESLELLE